MTETTPDLHPDRATWLSDRAVIRVGGTEARTFLNGLVTNDVLGVAEDKPRWSGLLTPQGKALFDFILWGDGPEDVLIDCEAAQADALVRRLTLYRLRRPVTIAREEGLAVHWSPDATDKPADPRLSALGYRWLAPFDPQTATHADSVWRAWRHSHGVVEGVGELGSDQTLWLEANARELNGVDFTKGCYVGQENTARMNWRQKVNRRLVVTRTDDDPGEAARAWYPELGIAVRLVRIGDIAGDPAILHPGWLKSALAGPDEA